MQLQQYLETTQTSRAQFASEIGVSVETVRRYLSGERFPDWSVIPRIIAATNGNVTANDFIRTAA